MTDSYKGADGNEIYFIDHRYDSKLKKELQKNEPLELKLISIIYKV